MRLRAASRLAECTGTTGHAMMLQVCTSYQFRSGLHYLSRYQHGQKQEQRNSHGSQTSRQTICLLTCCDYLRLIPQSRIPPQLRRLRCQGNVLQRSAVNTIALCTGFGRNRWYACQRCGKVILCSRGNPVSRWSHAGWLRTMLFPHGSHSQSVDP